MVGKVHNRHFYYVERAFALVGVLFMLGAFQGFFADLKRIDEVLSAPGSGTAGNISFQIFSTIIYVIATVVVLQRLDQCQWLIRKNKAIFLLVGLVILSTVWSIEPLLTLRRAIALLGTSIFGLYLAMRFRPHDLLRILALAFLLASVASLVAVFIAPEFGKHSGLVQLEEWRGIMAHKNQFGRHMVLGSILFFLLAWFRLYRASLSWAGFLLCSFLTIMSESRTAWVTGVALFILIWLLQMFRGPRGTAPIRVALVAGIYGVVGALILLNYYQVGVELLGRNVTLSARTKIWELAFYFGSDRPFLGHGYRAFWTQENVARLYSFLSWDAGFGHAHNSYIDLWLDLGFTGIAIFIVTLIVCAQRILMRLTERKDIITTWFAISTAFMVITATTEATILQQGTIEWTLYVSTLMYLSIPRPEWWSLTAEADTQHHGLPEPTG